MKSYFAKLAARATLPNAPTSPSRAIPMDDPFEKVAAPGTAAVTENDSLRERPENQSSEASQRQLAINTDEIVQGRSHTRAHKATSDSDGYGQPITPRISNPAPQHDQSERVRQIERLEQETLKPPAIREPEPDQTARAQTRQTGPLDPSASSTVSIEPRESNTSQPKDHAADDHDIDEVISLKKADEFMRALFAQRPAPPGAVSNQDTEQPAPVAQPVTPQESPSRLQPAVKPRQPAEPPEQPSLVIGKLTVEVVQQPPPSPPVTPRREVVVLRGTSGARRPAHSSQRFGLGQF